MSANRIAPDGTPCFAASHLGLFGLPMSNKKDARRIWVNKTWVDIENLLILWRTRTVRGSDYSPAIELSEQKDKLVTATGDTEKYSEKQANKAWLNSVYCFSRY